MTESTSEVRAKDVIRVAVRVGFMVDCESRFHALFYRDSDKRRIVIPVHAGGKIKESTLSAIIRDMGLEPEQFQELL